MAGPDIVLFVVGVLLFGGAATALIVTQGPEAFTGGGSGSPLQAYTISFSTRAGTPAVGSVADMGNADVNLDLPLLNVSKVSLVVECNADQIGTAAPFSLMVTVQAPNNLSVEPKGGSCGSPITFDIPIAPVPTTSAAVQAASDVEAQEKVVYPENATLASGTWTISITGARKAGSQDVPITQGNPGGTVTLTPEVYEARVSAVTR